MPAPKLDTVGQWVESRSRFCANAAGRSKEPSSCLLVSYPERHQRIEIESFVRQPLNLIACHERLDISNLV